MITKVCNTCNVELPLSKFKTAWAGVNYIPKRKVNKEERNPNTLKRNRCAACDGKSEMAKLKLEFLEAFGCKCSCCGESHPDFLTLDHVKDDGSEHRKVANCQQEMRRARREGWNKANWDCLCMNCNHAKGHYGGCPHKTGVTVAMAIDRMRQRNLKIGRSNGP